MSKQGLYDYMVDIGADDERLEQVSGLLEALKHIVKYGSGCDVRFIAKEAILKAEGK